MKQTASVGNNYTDTHTNVLAAAASITHTITNVVMCGLGLERTNQAAVTGTPVTTSNEVYDAYLAFLGVEGSLQCTCDPPPDCAAHICRKYGKMYYWVPIEHKRLFLQLSLITTAQRGKPLLPPNEFFTATVTGWRNIPISHEGDVGAPETVPGAPVNTKIILVLDREIPNDAGRVVLKLTGADGKDVSVTLAVAPYSQDGVFDAPLTREVVVGFNATQFSEKNLAIATPGDLPSNIEGRFYLDSHRPTADKTSDLLDRVNFNLQQIQFNQLRTSGGF
jgi:hypothetical protein